MRSHVDQLRLLGDSPAMQTLRLDIASAARTHAKVLITGETGVGKEVVARMIHEQSSRSRQSFVAVNCSGIPETLLSSELFGHARGSFTGAYRDKIGLVRQADHVTLFLDELGEMSLAMQTVLLRFAETGEIQPVGVDAPVGRTDVRLITATNRDLPSRIAAGVFREDLYYRVNVIQINIPPLRERGLDVLTLCRYYLEHASETYRVPCPQLTPDAEQVLLAHSWPGNVRELRNLTERLALRDSRRPVEAEDVTALIGGSPGASSLVPSPGARGADAAHVLAQQLWERLREGGDFWTVVQRPFRAHQITKAQLAALIDRGLQETRGSYRALVKFFNLPPSDYKRFHAFLYQQNCNLPVAPYRNGGKAKLLGEEDAEHRDSAATAC
jgi:DNA-binding NtrC family response regulator